MSTLKVDALSSKSTDTDLAITADGSGLVDIETGFKVSGTAGVPTADIRDDAVTLAKMAAGTDGNIISYDASGNPVAVATGTDGQVLTSSGAGAVCAFEDAAGGGAWEVLDAHTISSTDTEFTFTSGIDTTYNSYVIVIAGILEKTGGAATLLVQVSDDGGSSWETANYRYHTSLNTDNADTYVGEGSSSNGYLAIGKLASDSTACTGGWFMFNDPATSGQYPTFQWNVSGATSSSAVGGGVWLSTAAVDGIRFYLSTGGQLESGNATLYGISRS